MNTSQESKRREQKEKKEQIIKLYSYEKSLFNLRSPNKRSAF